MPLYANTSLRSSLPLHHLQQQPLCHRYDFLVCFIGTDLTFSNFLNFILHLGLITTPHVLHVHMTYVYSLFFMFLSSHDHMAKRSHYHIMIFLDFGVLIYGRIPTFIFPHFLYISATPKLPVHIDQRRPHLEKDTTKARGMVVRKFSTVLGRTGTAPD